MTSHLHSQLSEAEKSFKRACEQIIHLNRRLDEMAKRYDKASRENHRSFRYSLRLRMAVSEGVRNMYYEYAANKADLISELRYRVGLRSVADGMGLRTVGNVTSGRADRVEGEHRESAEWESTSDGVDGSSRRTNNVVDTVDTRVTNDKTSSPGSSRDSGTQEMENEDEDPTMPIVEGLAVGQPYDSSDIDSPSAGSSGISVINEASDDSDMMPMEGQALEAYFAADGTLVIESAPMLSRSTSPVSYIS